MNSGMLPLFKWTGGKRREIEKFENFYPDFVKNKEEYTFVEPFVGAGAVFWNLNNLQGKNIINDFDWDVANFYRSIRKQSKVFTDAVLQSSSLYKSNDDESYEKQSKNYYEWRNKDRNNGLQNLSNDERAARFWIVNQLSFSGMRRFNSKGEFNVPYGHYKNLNSSNLFSNKHVNLLNNTEILDGDYLEVVLKNDTPNTFIFIDPPYTRVMKEYSSDNEFGDDKQRELASALLNLKHASFMIVIDKSDLTMELYEENIVETYGLKYGVNIKNRFDAGVEHIVATNYRSNGESNTLSLFD